MSQPTRQHIANVVKGYRHKATKALSRPYHSAVHGLSVYHHRRSDIADLRRHFKQRRSWFPRRTAQLLDRYLVRKADQARYPKETP